MPQSPIRLFECSGMECGAVEAQEPVVRRVKILGWDSKNNRQYLQESVSPEQYAERVINLNHPGKQDNKRRVEDRFGWFEGVSKDGAGVWGDLHYNPKHPFAETFRWIAENKPSLIGLSHDALGTGKTKDGTFVVEKVLEVKSVDLVADPATTKGLFESMDPELNGGGTAAEEKSLEQQIGELVVAIIKDDCPAAEKRSKVLKALKLLDEPEAKETEESEEKPAEKPPEEDEEKKTEESLQALAKQFPGVKSLLERADNAETKLALRERHELAHRLCEEAKMPAVAVTKIFLEKLVEAKDEKEMQALIEDRKGVINVQKPRSTGPAANSGSLDNKSFAQQLTK